MSLQSVLARGRAAARARMTEQGKVQRPGELGDPDPDTGVVSPTFTTVWDGSGGTTPTARVRHASGVQESDVTAGEARSSTARYIVGLPLEAVGVQPGDVWDTTASTDPDLVDVRLRVLTVGLSAQTTERRLLCELVERRQA